MKCLGVLRLCESELESLQRERKRQEESIRISEQIIKVLDEKKKIWQDSIDYLKTQDRKIEENRGKQNGANI